MTAIMILRGLLRAEEHADDGEKHQHRAEIRAFMLERAAELGDAWGKSPEEVIAAVESTTDEELPRLTSGTLRATKRKAREAKDRDAWRFALLAERSAVQTPDGWAIPWERLVAVAAKMRGGDLVGIVTGQDASMVVRVRAGKLAELARLARTSGWYVTATVAPVTVTTETTETVATRRTRRNPSGLRKVGTVRTTSTRLALTVAWLRASGARGELRLWDDGTEPTRTPDLCIVLERRAEAAAE